MPILQQSILFLQYAQNIISVIMNQQQKSINLQQAQRTRSKKLQHKLIQPNFLFCKPAQQQSFYFSIFKQKVKDSIENEYFDHVKQQNIIKPEGIRIKNDQKIYAFPPIKNIRNILKHNKQDQKIIKNIKIHKKRDQFSRKMIYQSRQYHHNMKNIESFIKKTINNQKNTIYKPSQLKNKHSFSLIKQVQFNRQKSQRVQRSLRTKSSVQLQIHQNQSIDSQKPIMQWHEMITEYVKQHRSTKQMYFESFQEENYDNIPKIPNQYQIQQFLNEYEPINENIDIRQLLRSNFFAINYSQNCFYFGQMIGKKKSGVGIMINNDYCYEGEWKNNQKIKGIQINKYGIYKGLFFNNKKQGKGVFQWNNQSYYDGDWINDEQSGHGVWMNQDGQYYKGVWKSGKIQGFGTLYIKENKLTNRYRYYKGHFADFKQHGFGRQIFSNKDEFQGYFRNGKPNGKGIYKWLQGTVYEGQFRNGIRNDMGNLRSCFNLIYKGQFKSQKAQGQCQILFPNGDVYYGMMKNGKKNGKGTFIANKSNLIYNGYWKDDIFLEQFPEDI